MSNNFPPRNTTVLNSVLNAPLIVTAILGNTLVLAAILRTPSLRSPSIMLLCSLAVSDLLVGSCATGLLCLSTNREGLSLPAANRYGFFRVLCFALYDNSCKCRSALGSSLSHEISDINDNTSRYEDISNSLVGLLSVISVFPLEQEFLFYVCCC